MNGSITPSWTVNGYHLSRWEIQTLQQRDDKRVVWWRNVFFKTHVRYWRKERFGLISQVQVNFVYFLNCFIIFFQSLFSLKYQECLSKLLAIRIEYPPPPPPVYCMSCFFKFSSWFNNCFFYVIFGSMTPFYFKIYQFVQVSFLQYSACVLKTFKCMSAY